MRACETCSSAQSGPEERHGSRRRRLLCYHTPAMITSYNVISSDGFIAAPDGTEDFIPDEMWKIFLDLLPNYDAFVMSSKTYNAIQNYDAVALAEFEKLETKKLIVTSQEDFTPKSSYTKISSPEESLDHGANILLSSGPSLNESFLNANLIDKIILVTLPVSIGAGIKAFNEMPHTELTTELELENGGMWREYALI